MPVHSICCHMLGTYNERRLDDLACPKSGARPSNSQINVYSRCHRFLPECPSPPHPRAHQSDKGVFYRAWGWLYEHHPRTAIQNLHLLVKPVCKIDRAGHLAPHGYWKDLLNLVCLVALDQIKDRWPTFLHSRVNYADHESRDETPKLKQKRAPEEVLATVARERAEAKERRAERHRELHRNISQKLESDPRFRALYIAVARLFADQLVADIQTLDKLDALPSGPEFKEERAALAHMVSFAGKWAPTPGCTHDRHSNMGTAISTLLHFSSMTFAPNGVTISAGSTTPVPPAEAHILRSFYQRWVLRPLRAHLCCPEPLMAANRWKEIKYTRVPSLAMKQNITQFYLHDPEGFEAYLESVEKGKKSISGATLLPHDILRDAMQYHSGPAMLREGSVKPHDMKKIAESRKKLVEVKSRATEAQWKTMLARVKEAGRLENSLAICDVSGSMGALDSSFYDGRHVDPIFPAVALSIVLAQVASPPFNGGFITFSERPEFIKLDTSQTLGEMAAQLVGTAWGMNTDFDAVFLDLLLPLAKEHQLKPEDMVKRLFVFSDMQFDESRGDTRSGDAWETNHDVIERAYREAGYEVPEIVYWNLAGSVTTTPVLAEKQGVALMSGFSPNMMKVFMGEEDEDADWEDVGERKDRKEEEEKVPLTPREVMMKSLGKESFSGLVVVD
ncbi:hypothetical protein EUX98_g6351 [Antrodiella citrinella]|uniref:DUF2828 domain-containing protein n=1 Tax=Antrodiella citrinella TaxID=2447956 RepID=A0A4S4MP70_9APHY|nr:hypothetical protein EUX98_g6351 [Antrodiella citrinella]